MAPVTARIVLACPGPGRVTYLLGFGAVGDWEVVRDSRISMSRTFVRTTTVRGACRDADGNTVLARSRKVAAVDERRERDAILELSNAAREDRGVPPLAHDTLLDAVARAHARDMAERGYFSHVTPEGRGLAERLSVLETPLHAAAENIAGNETPRLAVRAWLNSPPHRANLLSPDYDRLGVGIWRTPSSPYTYYVQVFAK